MLKFFNRPLNTFSFGVLSLSFSQEVNNEPAAIAKRKKYFHCKKGLMVNDF
jgi:hypothetical protein